MNKRFPRKDTYTERYCGTINSPTVSSHFPLGISHTFAVLSADPDATIVPSGENDTLFT